MTTKELLDSLGLTGYLAGKQVEFVKSRVEPVLVEVPCPDEPKCKWAHREHVGVTSVSLELVLSSRPD